MSNFRATLSCLVQAQVCQNVIHFNKADAVDADRDALAADLRDNWLPQIRQFQHSGAQWFDIEVHINGSALASVHLTVSVFGVAGTSNQDIPTCGRVFKFLTAIAGRHGRGRIFIPGTSSQAYAQGLVLPSSITAGIPLINNLKARYVNAGHTSAFQLVVCPRNSTVDQHAVTDIIQRTQLGQMRSRGIGLGI